MKLISLIIILLLPKLIKPFFLNLLGHKVHKTAKISFSFIYSSKIIIGEHTIIKSFNLIYKTNLNIASKCIIGRFNVINGPFELVMKDKSALGKLNKLSRGKKGISYGNAKLTLGILTKITANHYIDITRNVSLGNYSILAGIRSQIWTHGYMHAEAGPTRFRVDGEVIIGDNVYIGSGSIINPGVTIANAINIGGNSSIAKSLFEPGMYVSQPLRYIPKTYEETKAKLRKVEFEGLLEEVYEK